MTTYDQPVHRPSSTSETIPRADPWWIPIYRWCFGLLIPAAGWGLIAWLVASEV